MEDVYKRQVVDTLKIDNSIKNIDVKFNEIDSQISERVDKQINENNEKLINSMNEYNNEMEFKINKYNTETECKLNSVVAVSYTHLDVYKRQVLRSFHRLGSLARPLVYLMILCLIQ